MKKLIGAFFLIAIVMATPACKKNYYPTVNQAFSAVYTITPNQWSSSDDGRRIFSSLNVPELTKDFVGNDGVIVYLSFDNGVTYEAIPEVLDGISYGTFHGLGFVTVDAHRIDGGRISAPGANVLAKVVLIYTESL